MSASKDRKVKKAIITHDTEEWVAEVGKQLHGKDRSGERLGSSATVISIHPDRLLLINDGKGGQRDPHAQVHGIKVVEYFDEDEDADDENEESP